MAVAGTHGLPEERERSRGRGLERPITSVHHATEKPTRECRGRAAVDQESLKGLPGHRWVSVGLREVVSCFLLVPGYDTEFPCCICLVVNCG